MKRSFLFILVFAALTIIAPNIAHSQDVRNSSYSMIGKIDSDGTVRNSSYSMIGKVESDGTVRNSSYSMIGKIDNDGTVRNSSYSTIGTAKGIKREWAAIWFFFNFF